MKLAWDQPPEQLCASRPPAQQKPSSNQWQHLFWHVLYACDSHNDAIATALGVLGGTLEDLRSAETARMVDEMMPSI